MPRHDELYVPAFKTRIVPCADCNAPCECGWKRRTPVRCEACAVKRMMACVTQMHDRVGPYYERWSLAMLSFVRRECGGYRGDPAHVPDSVSDT